MNVLVCIPCLLTGGTEIQTLSLVEALVQSGHKVRVACYFEHHPDMVARFRSAGAEVTLFSENGARPAGVKNTLVFLWKGFRKELRLHKPDVAHVQYMAPGALPIIILRLLGVKNIVASAHTSADIYPSLKQIHFLNRHLLRAFQCITLKAETSFFGSARLFDGSMKLKKHGNHFTIYNNLPSHIRISGQPRNHAPQTIGVVSRLEPIKGMDLVIPAFSEVLKQHPQMHLIVGGDGSLREDMERQVKEFEIPEDKVEFLGRVSQENLEEVYDRIDILLMPSRSEGFGLTAIEGMARSCVPVVADTGGLPEVVKDGECGLLHISENVRDISSKINSLILDNAEFQILSENCTKYSKSYSFEKYAELMSSLYSLIN